MKAINKNTKYALPLVLLGLLALDTSWHRFFKGLNMASGTFASSTAEDVRQRAGEVCQDPRNDVAAALSTAQRQGSAEFYFKDNNNDDLKDTLRAEGESVDIEYNGVVSIRKITEIPVERPRIRRTSRVLEHFGDHSSSTEEDPEPVVLEDGEVYDGECNERAVRRGECEIPKYDVYEIRVRTQTTEGDWCDDCDNESAEKESVVKYIEVKVSPRGDSMADICQDTFSIAQNLFQETERDMKEGIVSQIEEIAELAEQEELEDYAQSLEDECRIKPGASLDDIREYRENKTIDDEFSYAGKPDEKAECVAENMDSQDSQADRTAYFRSHMVPLLQNQLTSTDPQERQLGQELLLKLRQNEYGKITTEERGHLNFMTRQSQSLDEIYRLTAMSERFPDNQGVKMALDNALRRSDMEYFQLAQSNSVVAQEAGFWHQKITNLTTTAQYNIPGLTTTNNPMNYNLSGRTSRLAEGHLPLSSEFAQARASILNVPDFVNQPYYRSNNGMGTDAYEQDRFNRNTRPPGPEMSNDRLVRNRN